MSWHWNLKLEQSTRTVLFINNTNYIQYITYDINLLSVFFNIVFTYYLLLGTPIHRIPEPEQSSPTAEVITRDRKNWTRTFFLPSTSIYIPFIGRHHQSSLLKHRCGGVPKRFLSFILTRVNQPRGFFG